jgi:hypothetical protein
MGGWEWFIRRPLQIQLGIWVLLFGGLVTAVALTSRGTAEVAATAALAAGWIGLGRELWRHGAFRSDDRS